MEEGVGGGEGVIEEEEEVEATREGGAWDEGVGGGERVADVSLAAISRAAERRWAKDSLVSPKKGWARLWGVGRGSTGGIEEGSSGAAASKASSAAMSPRETAVSPRSAPMLVVGTGDGRALRRRSVCPAIGRATLLEGRGRGAQDSPGGGALTSLSSPRKFIGSASIPSRATTEKDGASHE